jgi:hypothetical protein
MIIAAAIFALLLGAYIFVVLPQADFARRTFSVATFLILIAIVYGGAAELLGRPKPLRLEWRDAEKAQVVSAVPVENVAIYMWLTMPGSQEPRAYTLPWSPEAAQQLQDAMTKAETDGTAVEMSMPFDMGEGHGEPMFYAKPQPPLPVKTYQSGTEPLIYEQPDDPS